jgi:hypothetical protein
MTRQKFEKAKLFIEHANGVCYSATKSYMYGSWTGLIDKH